MSVNHLKCSEVTAAHKSINNKSTHNHTNMQYDQYNSTKKVRNSFRQDQEDKLNNKLLHQGSFFSSISKF